MTTMIERYVAEAVRHVSAGSRHEVTREIHGMVDEMVEARVSRGVLPVVATEGVLNELGSPRRLAHKFGDTHRYLIGPGQYDEYVEALRTMLLRVLPLVAIVVFAVQIMNGDGGVGSAVGGAVTESLWTVYLIGLQMAVWGTVAFVIMDRSRRDEPVPAESDQAHQWTVADLPEVEPRRQISMADTLAGLGFTLFVGFILVMVYRNGMEMYVGDKGRNASGDPIPFFHPDIPRGVVWVVIGLLGADIILEVVKSAVGFWTRSIVVAQILLAVLWAGAGMLIIGQWELVNPGIDAAVSADVTELLMDSWFEMSVLATLLVVSAYSIWEAVRGHVAWREQDDEWTV